MISKLEKREELANALSHGLGVGLSIAGLVLLVVRAALYGDAWQVVSFAIYGASLIILYLASTLYHSFHNPKVKRFLRMVDHSAIYLLIAGTYTPFVLVTLRGPWGWSLFGTIWGLALLGILFKAIFGHRYELVSTIFYLLMGWVVVIALKPLLSSLDMWGFVLLLAGGLAYSLGVIFFVWERLPYNHAIWHGFVLTGSAFHFLAVFLHVAPKPV